MSTERTAAQEHELAAEQVERARGLAGAGLSQIEDISRGMKDTAKDGKRTDLSPAEQHADQARRVN
jgi:hypothetical protein